MQIMYGLHMEIMIKYIYEEKETNQIITTYEKKIAAIGFEDNKITINGSDKNI